MIDAVCRSRLTSNISSRVTLADTYAPDDDDDDTLGSTARLHPAHSAAAEPPCTTAAPRFPGSVRVQNDLPGDASPRGKFS